MTRPREGPDARSMSPSEAAAKKIADNTIEILRAERDRLFNTVAQQAAEIERLRAFEMAARDLNNDLTRIAKERDEMATQIKKLKEDLEQSEICIRAKGGKVAIQKLAEALNAIDLGGGLTMILTEEQRGALARAIDYINETDLPIGELDGFDREVLRAMIDSSDPITDVTELVELLAAGEHEQWAAWAQAILDSEPGLSDGRKAAWPGLIATPYENLSEEMKDEDRRVVHLRSQVVLDYIQQQSAEIERLRAALDESEQILAHKTKTATHWYEEGLKTRADLVQSKRVVEQQAARLKELEDVHKRSGVKYAKIINELRSSVYANIPGLDVGKIGPDAKPRVWQITDERKAAIGRAIESVVAADSDSEEQESEDVYTWRVLRDMLEEAE